MTPRKRPAPSDRPSPQHTNTYDATTYRRQDGFTAPDPEARREAQLLAELEALGYSISVRCRVCGHPLTTRLSTSLHIGPKCRAKVVVAE